MARRLRPAQGVARTRSGSDGAVSVHEAPQVATRLVRFFQNFPSTTVFRGQMLYKTTAFRCIVAHIRPLA